MLLSNILKITILFWGCVMVSLGASMMLFPEIVISNYAITPMGPTGWSAISGNFATLICFLGISAILGISRSNRQWLVNVLLMESLILAGRVVAISEHGYSMNVAVLLGAELLIAMIIVVYLRLTPGEVRI